MIILLYLANVLIISIPLAIFEIWLERFKHGPWGEGEFQHRFWGHKIDNKILCTILQKKYVTPYHLVVFIAVLGALFGLEWHYFATQSISNGWIISAVLPIFGAVKIIPLIFFPALWLGVATVEDLFWFALNWRVPNSLMKLIRKEFGWHTAYYHINPSKTWWLPKFYLQTLAIVLVLFTVHELVIYFT